MPDPIAPAEIAVIGCGPAGLAAALQLKRYGLSPLVFEKGLVGGLLKNANLVENYPGFPGGISGSELVSRMVRHMDAVGVETVNEEVTCLDVFPGSDEAEAVLFRIQTPQREACARQVILATGTRPKPFKSAPVSGVLQNRVFYEVYPLLDERGRQIVIVGAGDAAFDYALNLAERGNQVIILNRDTRIKCLPLLWERSSAQPAIRYFEHTPVTALFQDEPGGALRVQCGRGSRTWDMMAHFILFAVGREPETGLLSPELQRRLPALEAADRLYPVGDVKNGLLRQTAIAAGDGLRAAMQIYHTLQNGG